MTLINDVLPAPERPNTAVIPLGGKDKVMLNA
jgi:hypothetical protein